MDTTARAQSPTHVMRACQGDQWMPGTVRACHVLADSMRVAMRTSAGGLPVAVGGAALCSTGHLRSGYLRGWIAGLLRAPEVSTFGFGLLPMPTRAKRSQVDVRMYTSLEY